MSNCTKKSIGITPIIDMEYPQTYKNYFGGLYGEGSNVRPPDCEARGVSLANELKMAARNVLAIVGASSTRLIGEALIEQAALDPAVSKRLTIANLAHAGQDADELANPTGQYWTQLVPQTLAADSLTPEDVKVAWIMTARRPAGKPFPENAQAFQDMLRLILANVRHAFPYCKMVYLTGGLYMGYWDGDATAMEPDRFEQGFGIKWFIREQLTSTKDLYVDWGDYFWTDGATPRTDGLALLCPKDVKGNGQHPSPAGSLKMALHLIQWWKNDVTAQPWFLE